MCPVFCWQSIRAMPQRCRWAAAWTKAVLEASLRRANIDSPKKHPSDLHAVAAAGQLGCAVGGGIPAFEGMGVPQAVQRGIGSLKLGFDPSTVLPRARRGGAGGNHLGKAAVGGNAVGFIAQVFVQRAADVQRVRLDNGARGGGKPVVQIVLAEPRENAARIGGQQACGREIGADAD